MDGGVCGVRLHFFIEKSSEANREGLAKRYLENVFQAKEHLVQRP